ncbi:MAG: glycosyltransferase family 2 protein [Dehalococcoidia bacterium]
MCAYASTHRAQTSVAFEVFVVDNASVDGSAEMVAREYPWVRLLANAANIGFPRANNQAIPLARGRYVLLLNPDTEPLNGAIDRLVSYLDAHPAAGAAGARLEGEDGSIHYAGARSFPTPSNLLWDLLGLSTLLPHSRRFGASWLRWWDHDDTRPVPVISGSCMMIRRGPLIQVGMLATDVFMYMEDYELCYRLWRQGQPVHYVHTARIRHFGGRSSRQLPERLLPFKLMIDGCLVFMARHYGRRATWTLRCFLVLAAVTRLALVSGPAAPVVRRRKGSQDFDVFRARTVWLLRRGLGLTGPLPPIPVPVSPLAGSVMLDE